MLFPWVKATQQCYELLKKVAEADVATPFAVASETVVLPNKFCYNGTIW